jgi:hypothetical protein
MSFTCSNGNSQHNFFLDHECPDRLDRIEAFRPADFSGLATVFVHEFGDKMCLYTGSAVHAYDRDFKKGKLIGALPPGDSVLFSAHGAWVSHEGPFRRYDKDLNPAVETYIVPHGGPWTSSLGVFAKNARIAMALNFCGGPREWAPELQFNSAKGVTGATGPDLQVDRKTTRPGDVESMVLLGERLFAAGEKSLLILSLEGALLKEIPLEEGILHLAASESLKVVGGFCRTGGRWLYREFDPEGKPGLSFTLTGAKSAGYAVFDPDGSRYLMSEMKLVKLDKGGQWIWSKTLQGGSPESPRFLVYRGGRCAFMDGGALVLLDPEGVTSHRIPLPARKIASPPYLDAGGSFWLGLAKQPEKIMKVLFRP